MPSYSVQPGFKWHKNDVVRSIAAPRLAILLGWKYKQKKYMEVQFTHAFLFKWYKNDVDRSIAAPRLAILLDS